MTTTSDQDHSQPVTYADLARAMAINGAIGNFQAFAIVGALVQRGALDPMSVATWAEFFAGVQSKTSPPDIREAINEALRGFANSIRTLATMPTGSGKQQ